MLKKIEINRNEFTIQPVTGEKDLARLYWSQFKMGDTEAYNQLYRMFSVVLFRYGRKIIHDREIVKDCIHDLFVELWRNKQNLGNPESVKNYLLKSIRTKLYRKVKSNKLDTVEDLADSKNFGCELSYETQLISNQRDEEYKHRLNHAVQNLTRRQREIIFFLYYEDMSPNEVANIMSLTLRTVYNTTYNALQVLKKSITLKNIFCWLMAVSLL